MVFNMWTFQPNRMLGRWGYHFEINKNIQKYYE